MVPTSTFRPSADGCNCSSAAYDGTAAYSFYKDPEENVKKKEPTLQSVAQYIG